MTGGTGKTDISLFLCIRTRGIRVIKNKKIYIVWKFPGLPGFYGMDGHARSMLEKDIVKAILQYLRGIPRCFAWKTHGGMYGTAGIPDVVACINGRFYAFEVKQPSGKLTRLQENTLEKICAAGGTAAKVVSVEDVRCMVEKKLPPAYAEEYWQEVCRLNEQINGKILEAADLRRKGRFKEYALMEQEIDREIDVLVDLKERFRQHRREDCV